MSLKCTLENQSTWILNHIKGLIIVMRKCRKSDRAYDVDMSISREKDKVSLGISVRDYVRFVFYCLLLIIPAYAITKSAIAHDWIMMILDLLLIPVGFIHGLFMILGFAG